MQSGRPTQSLTDSNLYCSVMWQANQFLQEAYYTYSQITTAVCTVNCWSLCQECHKDRLCIQETVTETGAWADALFRKREESSLERDAVQNLNL